MIAVINAHMVGKGLEEGTGVNWNEPDYFTEQEFTDLIEATPEEFAEDAPHMIVWVIDLAAVLTQAWQPHYHWPAHRPGCPACEARAAYQRAMNLPSNVLPSVHVEEVVDDADRDEDDGA